jgi:hypothetical protein
MKTNLQKKRPAVQQKKTTKPVSNSVQIDANNPIPWDIGGHSFSFINQAKYLPFLGRDDDFGSILLEARLLSTTQGACIKTKRDYCAGTGMVDMEGGELPPAFLEMLKGMNLKNEDCVEVNKQIFESFFTYGNAPIEIVRMTVAGAKKLFVYVHNFLEWRLMEPDENGIVRKAIHSKLFLRQGHNLTKEQIEKAKQLPLYNPMMAESENWLKDDKGVERTMIWYKNSMAGYDHYGMSSSVSSLIYQVLEYKGARYNLDNFENNMVIGGMLALKGNLGQTEANRIGRDVIKTHTGDGKRGRIIVVASEEGIDGSDWHSFDTTKDGSYLESDDRWSQKIILANEWDAVLAGMVSNSSLGKGSGFLSKIFEVKQLNVIGPAQTHLINNVWKHILKIAGEWLSFKTDGISLAIKGTAMINSLHEVDIATVATVNEVREANGLPADDSEKGKKYLHELKAVKPENTKEVGDA